MTSGWIRVYLALSVHGARLAQVSVKITLKLDRFCAFVAAVGGDRITPVVTGVIVAQLPRAFALRDSAQGIG